MKDITSYLIVGFIVVMFIVIVMVVFNRNVTDAIWGLHDIIKQDIVPTVTIIIDISLEEQERRLSYRRN